MAESEEEEGRNSAKGSAVAASAATSERPDGKRRRPSAALTDPLLLRAGLSGKATKEKGVRVRMRGEEREDAEGPSVLVVDERAAAPASTRFIDANLPEEVEEDDGDFRDDEAGTAHDDDWDEDVRDENLFDVSVLEENRGDVLVSSDVEFVSDRRENRTAE